MNNKKLANQILNDTQYATIATADQDGKPWNTPVYCAFDDQMNIYWSSHPKSVHSQNISNNGNAFIVIYNSKAGEGQGQGLYMKAHVEQLSDESEIKYALNLLGKRRGRPFNFIEKFIGNGSQRIYKAIPQTIWVNDADQDADGDFIRDYRMKV